MKIGLLGGRLMQAAICGLLAATVIPAAASADLTGGVTVTTPIATTSASTSVLAPAVLTPSIPAPTVSPSVSASMPVASMTVSTSRAPSVSSAVTPTATKTEAWTRLKKRKKARHAKATKPQSSPKRSFMTAISTPAPFTGTFTNTCVFPAEEVTVTGHSKLTTITQSDGSIATTASVSGGSTTVVDPGPPIVPLFGVKYSFSDETRTWIFGPGTTVLAFYHYQKLVRAGDVKTTVGGDDFYIRFFFSIPLDSAGVPDFSSLNTTMDGACR
jgi:hypothetical protein